jgi:hypothetical protein
MIPADRAGWLKKTTGFVRISVHYSRRFRLDAEPELARYAAALRRKVLIQTNVANYINSIDFDSVGAGGETRTHTTF